MKACQSTVTYVGCGEVKPDEEFRVIRTNKNNGNKYRERLCLECRKRSRRIKKLHAPKDEAALYSSLSQLWR